MIGLKTARVSIVDDRMEDALPLIRALSKNKIGSNYFNGEFSELPDSPISGIRLLFLDLNLLEGAPQGAQAPKLVEILNRLISFESNGPLLIVIWSTRPGTDVAIIKEFQEDVIHQLETPPPDEYLFIVRLHKPDYFTDNGDEGVSQDTVIFNIDKILESILKKINEQFPLEVFLSWEQRVHDAATDTIDALTKTIRISSQPNQYSQRLSGALKSLAAASLGAEHITAENIVQGVSETLNPLHFDRLEKQPSLNLDTQQWATFTSCDFIRFDDPLIPLVNSMLAIANNDGTDSHYPGSVYISQNENNFLESVFGLSQSELRRGVIDYDSILKVHEDDLKNAVSPFTPEQIIGSVQRAIENAKSTSIPVAVEITPACDYTNKKSPMIRLIPGVLLGAEVYKYLKGPAASYLWTSKPLSYNDIYDRPFIFVFNARYVVSFNRERSANLPQPVFRLRSQYLVDIQAWFARQSARPGVTSLE